MPMHMMHTHFHDTVSATSDHHHHVTIPWWKQHMHAVIAIFPIHKMRVRGVLLNHVVILEGERVLV